MLTSISGDRPRRRLTLALALVSLAFAGCSSSTPAEGGRDTSGATTATTVRPSGSGTTAVAHPVVRTCNDGPNGDVGDWRRSSLVVGPIGFINLRLADTRPAPTQPGGRAAFYLTVAMVKPGSAVKVRVAASAATYASLLFDRMALGSTDYSRGVAVGVQEVTFIACGSGSAWTQFLGGFLVDGKRCVPLEVRSLPNSAPKRVVVSFGAGTCS